LGIPTVADRIAQEVVKRYLEPILEAIFHVDSYGYRPGRSAIDAVRETRQRCWRYDWVLDVDVRSYFDSIDWELLLRAVRKHTDCPWARLYIERWLKAPVQMEDGGIVPRTAGTPQGGVVSPCLANLFLHYAFDMWMVRLVLHPQKTKLVYCRDANRKGDYPVQTFDFLGYEFRPRTAVWRGGKLGVSFLPAASPKALKAIRQTVRRWALHRRSDKALEDLARMFNPHIQGWINYYSHFYGSALCRTLRRIDAYLVRWGRNKYKRLRSRTEGARVWFARVVRANPALFAHWRLLYVDGRTSGAV
jgi:hypothetical protein